MYQFLLLLIFLFWLTNVYSTISAYMQKPLVVIIPSYNNSRWYAQNLDSVFMQIYENYRVIYINDCSTDNTGFAVQEYVKEHHCQEKITIIHNEQRYGVSHNLYHAIHSCDDWDIIINLDGDDRLAHEHVFLRINQEYANPHVWLTYGDFELFPFRYYLGVCSQLPSWVIEKNAYRDYKWSTSHLRTYYAGLFKKINRADLLYNDNFYMVAADLAIMFPMLEMAAERSMFIAEILYNYNFSNPLSDFRRASRLQRTMEEHIRSLPRYHRIEHFTTKEEMCS